MMQNEFIVSIQNKWEEQKAVESSKQRMAKIKCEELWNIWNVLFFKKNTFICSVGVSVQVHVHMSDCMHGCVCDIDLMLRAPAGVAGSVSLAAGRLLWKTGTSSWLLVREQQEHRQTFSHYFTWHLSDLNVISKDTATSSPLTID